MRKTERTGKERKEKNRGLRRGGSIFKEEGIREEKENREQRDEKKKMKGFQ